jgi:uncharacterized protein YukE
MAQWQVGGNVDRIMGLRTAQSAAHAGFQAILNDAHQLALQTRAGWDGAGDAEFGQVEARFNQHSQAVQDAFHRLIASTDESAAGWASACARLTNMW